MKAGPGTGKTAQRERCVSSYMLAIADEFDASAWTRATAATAAAADMRGKIEQRLDLQR
ncbi:hypothetical protein PE066_08570 [Ramlibacter tataouinensis]|uniref:hypothetical protein n=1 Tax=Ramlibacter tataouinensis TaxID=94132 RepID=UPI0022F3F07F|nr:hypothetical protein [Ramlibacter tataouinensis]WBY03570.1 hypothetical protein PE066_08570 [Ramlibacter tataouinensis]